MTLAPERTRTRPPRRAAIGIVCLILGMGAMVTGGLWTALDQGGWPWTGSISHAAGSDYEGTIRHPDGRDEVFRAATESEILDWMHRRNEELKRTYHLDRKIAAGQVLFPLGFGVTAVGGGVLIWWSSSAFRRRRTVISTTAPPEG